MKRLVIAVAIVCWAAPAGAQFGRFQKGLDQAKKLQGLKVTEQEEQAIGADVSQRLRLRYGVVQDPAVTKYVALVGTVIAQASSRPDLPWRFIVLDTAAVNAFAAPGGYIHITRGALGLIENEAELAGVLGHEIGHVTEKHTIKAIQKSNAVKLASDETLSGNKALLKQVADKTYDSIIENAFDRGDEMDADKVGVAAASKVGYAPIGLADFLQRLADRNKGATTKHGLFASHPDIDARIKRIKKEIADDHLTSTALVAARYKKFISYEATPQADIAMVTAGAAGLAEGSSSTAEPPKEKKKGFGLSSLMKPAEQTKTAEVTASGGARGVGDPDRDAKGGGNPAIVAVTVTPADLAEFEKGITG